MSKKEVLDKRRNHFWVLEGGCGGILKRSITHKGELGELDTSEHSDEEILGNVPPLVFARGGIC